MAANGTQSLILEKRILVPVDFGPNALPTIKTAAYLAHIHSASLTLIHSFIDPYLSGQGVQLADDLTYDILEADARQKVAADAKRQMDNFAESLHHEMDSGTIFPIHFATVVEEGVPEDVIIAHAKAHPPMLTVMSTRNALQKEREMLGSVTAEVLDLARTPVITFPAQTGLVDINQFKNILFFCNADTDDLLAFSTLAALIPGKNVKVILAIIPSRRKWLERITGVPENTNANQISQFFASRFPSFQFTTVNTQPDQIIPTLSALHANQNFNLIVAPNKKMRNIIGHIFHPSLIRQITFTFDIPLLMIPV